jgi:ribosomal-protein-serine acetyltransferase
MAAIYRIPTSRLTLRCWKPEDAPQLQESIASSLPELQASIPWIKNAPIADTERHLETMREDFLSERAWSYGIFDLGESMVIGGLRLQPGEPGVREMSYWIRTSCTGRGYATEAVSAATVYTFTNQNVERIVIRCHCRNKRGAAIPQRLGYRLAGKSPACPEALAAEPREAMIWELTRARFNNVAALPTESRPWLS